MISNKKSTIVTVLILVGIIVLALFVIYEFTSPTGYYARQHSDIRLIEQEATNPYTDLHGNAVKISDFYGTPLVINAWASWSPFSKSDFEILEALKKKYGDAITVIAVNRMETKETADAYLKTLQSFEGIRFVVDPTDHLFKVVDGYAMPETLIYDAVGNIVFHKRGSLSVDELDVFIESLREKK